MDGQRSNTKPKGDRKESEVRILNIPTPVYKAKHFSQMIDWDTEDISVPPCLRKYTDEQIRKFEDEPFVLPIPSNSQHVERFIQLIAKNGTKAATAKLRDGLVRATIKSRQRRSKPVTKADFAR